MSTPAFDYTTWIDEQATRIVAEMREAARRGAMRDAALYVVPSYGDTAGRLLMAEGQPSNAMLEVVWLSAAHGTHIMRVPYSDVRSLLWHACRRAHIVPIGREHEPPPKLRRIDKDRYEWRNWAVVRLDTAHWEVRRDLVAIGTRHRSFIRAEAAFMSAVQETTP